MSTKYTKKHKMPEKILCANCKIIVESGKKCLVCKVKSKNNNLYWSGNDYVKDGPTCMGYSCKNIVHNPKRTKCLECFLNEYYDT